MKALTDEQKEAARIRARAWAARNPDKVRERSRRRGATPEARAYAKAYRDAHKAERAEYNRHWRETHPEKVLAFAAAYRERNRAGINAKNRQANWTVTPTRPCPLHCELCDRLLEPGKAHMDHDHVLQKFRGWLCNRCNLALGHLGDSIAGLERALAYLRRCG